MAASLKLSRAQFRALPYVDADAPGWRRLAAGVLLQACREHARGFIHSERATIWADLLGLAEWPPPGL